MAKRRSKRFQAMAQLIILVGIILVVNIISVSVYERIDLTKEKRFTLSGATKDLLQNLDDIAYVKVYLKGDFPAGFKRLQRSTEEILEEFEAYAGRNLEYEFINPSAGNNPQQREEVYRELMDKGLQPTNLQVQGDEAYSEKIIFPGAIIYHRGHEIPIQLLESQVGVNPQQALNNSVQLLEYKFANAIQKAARMQKLTVAFLEGHGELGQQQVADISATLEKLQYEVRRFDITDNLYIPPTVDVAIIARPTIPFDEKDKFKIDQYIMGGGSVLWLLDEMDITMDSLKGKQMHFATGYDLNLQDMLFKYGVRVNPDLVQDLQSNQIGLMMGEDNAQMKLFPWFYYPVITSDNNHPINKNIGPVALQYASSIDTVRAEGIDKTVLLSSSEYSKALMSPVRVHFSILRNPPDPERYTQQDLIMGVLLQGEFESVFKNRLAESTKAMLDTLQGMQYREESVPTKMIIIGDGDIIRNDIGRDGSIYPLGFYRDTEQTFANKDFLLNAIEYLVDESGLIETRNKEVQLRLLDRTRVKEEKGQWQLLNIGLPIVITIIFGLAYNFIRRRRFGR